MGFLALDRKGFCFVGGWMGLDGWMVCGGEGGREGGRGKVREWWAWAWA